MMIMFKWSGMWMNALVWIPAQVICPILSLFAPGPSSIVETIHTRVLFGFTANNMAPTSVAIPWLFEKPFLSLGFPFYTFCNTYKHLTFFPLGVSLSTPKPIFTDRENRRHSRCFPSLSRTTNSPRAALTLCSLMRIVNNNNRIHHLLSMCHVPSIGLSTLAIIINLYPTTILQGKYFWSHLSSWELSTWSMVMASEWKRDLNPGLSITIAPCLWKVF